MPKSPSRTHALPLPDRYALYEKAVQEPNDDLEVLERVLKRTGRRPLRLREDFSGTSLLSATWVLKGPQRTATAVDFDPEVHAWARAHRLPGMGAAARRLRLVEADVRRAPRGPFDAVLALNFSYMALKRRAEMRDYFVNARRALAPGGVFMLDIFGGTAAPRGMTDRRRIGKGITYLWDQEAPDPITHHLRAAIHFRLADGRCMERAFTYDWRLWSLPELHDLLEETGFADIEVLWDVEPVGAPPRYVPRRHAENTSAWLAYLVARRPS